MRELTELERQVQEDYFDDILALIEEAEDKLSRVVAPEDLIAVKESLLECINLIDHDSPQARIQRGVDYLTEGGN